MRLKSSGYLKGNKGAVNKKIKKDRGLLHKSKQHASTIEATVQSVELSQNQSNVIPLTGITFNRLDACTD